MRLRFLPTVSLITFASIAIVCGGRFARAGWDPNGASICPACGVNIMYRDPSLASDGVGGLYASWFANPFLLRVQHLLANGDLDPAWPAMGVAPTGLVGMNFQARLAPDGSGGVFASWVATGCVASCASFDEGRVYVQRIGHSGALSTGWPADGIQIGSNPVNERPLLEPDGQGGVLVETHQIRFTPVNPIRLTRVNAAGNIQWPASFADGHVAPNSPELEDDPSLAADGAGGAFVAWSDRRGAIPQIYLQHFDAAGNLFDSSGVAMTSAPLAQRRPKLLPDGQGGVFLAWEDSTGSSARDIRAQRYNGLMQPQWGAGGVAVTPGVAGDQSFVALASDGAGGIYLAWADHRGTNTQVYATRLDGNGQRVSPWVAGGQPIHSGSIWYGVPNIVSAPSGGFYASWIEPITMAIRIEADGTPAPGMPSDGIPLCTGNCGSIETGTYLAADGMGGALAVWDEWRPGPNPGQELEDSFAAKMNDAGIVATLASLVSSSASSQGVRLEWQLNEPATLDIERTESTGLGASWSRLESAASDASGRLVVEDDNVRAGARYGYRLANSGGAILAETWVEVPTEATLSLQGARPNPASGELNLAFSLRDRSPAMLELLDVAGRRVASQRVEGLGPGSHLLHLDEAERLPAGVYTARLIQSGRVATMPVILVR